MARKTQFKETTGGLLGGSTVLPHEIEIELNNRLRFPASVEVRERVPVTQDESIKLEETARPAWEKDEKVRDGVQVDGARQWRVTVPPGQKPTLTAQFAIRIPGRQDARRRKPEGVSDGRAQPLSTRVARVVVMEDRAQVERRGELELPGRAPARGEEALAAGGGSLAQGRGDGRQADRREAFAQLGGEAEGRPDGRRERAAQEVPPAGEAGARARRSAGGPRRPRRGGEPGPRRSFCAIAEQAGFGQADPAKWTPASRRSRRSWASSPRPRSRRSSSATSPGGRWSRRAPALGHRAARGRPHLLAGADVDAAGGKVAVRLSYLVPCAVWRPAYRASLGADSVRLESEAVVWQRTGEDVARRASCRSPPRGRPWAPRRRSWWPIG